MASCWRNNRKYNKIQYDGETVDIIEDNEGGGDGSYLIRPQPTSCLRQTPEEMLQRASNEKKYKYSLVSVLIIGIVLILLVNLSLGYRNCGLGHTDAHQQVLQDEIDERCYDTTTNHLFPWQDYRLPNDVIPLHYHIFIHPNLESGTYKGSVSIKLKVTHPTQHVVLHNNGNNITYVGHGNKKATKVSQCDSNEMLAVFFDSPLDGDFVLDIHFTNRLHQGLNGFYLSKYTDINDNQHVIATTQFESVAARKAFPCFDEPELKANFTLQMVRESHQTVLFNTPLKETTQYKDTNLLLDTFDTSVEMSTYLVAFVVSNFISSNCQTQRGVKVSVYSQPDKVNDTQYAANFSCDVLDYYEKLFDINYPLPKLDLVAIPDFAAGAMENWGLVTYRETALLYNPTTSSLDDKQWIGKVIAHELAHQWFGNLVTMKWWDDLWLNEGFASYMEYRGMDQVEPSWSVMDDFLLDHTSIAMDADSYVNTHQISQVATNNMEIDQLFDVITYDKGACLISMLIGWLGEEIFFNGITSYLNKYKYQNAENKDLIEHLENAAPQNKKDKVKNMMETWTTQVGFPIIHISMSDDNKIILKQKRFIFPSGSGTEEPQGLWHIPISYTTSTSNTPHRYLLVHETSQIDLNANVKWIKLNVNQTGYYRVNYDDKIWKALIGQLLTNHKTAFTSRDRVGLISDAFTSAYVGLISYQDVLPLCEYLSDEDSYAPLDTAITELKVIDRLLRFHVSASTSDLMREHIKKIFSNKFDELLWKDSSHLSLQNVKIQRSIVETICLMGHESCLKQSINLFGKWIDNSTEAIPSNWISLVFNTALKYGPSTLWKKAWNIYLKETDPNMKSKLLAGLSLTTNGDHIMFLLQQIEHQDGDVIKSQDHAKVITHASSSLSGSTLAWGFLQNNWNMLTDVHGTTSFAFRAMVQSCMRSLLRSSDMEKAEDFFEEKNVSELNFVKKTLEAARVRIKWSENNKAHIEKWLTNNLS